MPTYIGVDFSGNQAQWRPNRVGANVWIARLETNDDAITLASLHRVQGLPGDQRPFKRLVALLQDESVAAAAIDAPSSVPWWFFGQRFGDHTALLTTIHGLQIHGRQDFPSGHAFLACVSAHVQFKFSKPLRVTEHYWAGRRVNVRSTVWQGPRPGAPFASACIKLLALVQRPIWPCGTPPEGTTASEGGALLIEAFPAAQLRRWELPCAGYNGLLGQEKRVIIVDDLEANRGLKLQDDTRQLIQGNADALDAVLCAYAARAVKERKLGIGLPPFDVWRREGWIAVHI